MKKLFFYAAALLAAISFSACSNDDDETTLPATPENIAGTWQIIQEKGWEIDWGEKDTFVENYPDEDGWYYTFTFDKDGSFTETEIWGQEAVDTNNGSYSISGKELEISCNYGYYGYSHFEIKKLTESQLVLFVIMDKSDFQSEYTATFKRIE